MIVKTLYSKSSMGQILHWSVELEGNKYRFHTGIEGGTLVASDWQVSEGNSLRKPEEQAMAEVLSKIEKKRKAGYTDLVTLAGQTAYTKPMLANKFEDHKHKIQYPVIVDTKLNGVRCIAREDGLWTRRGERIESCPHIIRSLANFFTEFPDAVLDGELYNHSLGYKLNEMCSLVRKLNLEDEDFEQSAKIVGYTVYDGYGFKGIDENTNNLSRRVALAEYFSNNPTDSVFDVIWYTAANEDEVMKAFYKFLEMGYEGAIIRSTTAPYKHSRSQALLKLKPKDDAEFEILDILEGTGNWAHAAKTVRLKWKDSFFDAGIKGSYDDNATLLMNKNQYIGKSVTVVYLGFTGLGTPNHAQWNPYNSERID